MDFDEDIIAISIAEASNKIHHCESRKMLVGFGLSGCHVCYHLMWTAMKVMGLQLSKTRPSSWIVDFADFSFLWIELHDANEMAALGLNIRLFPTLIGFVNAMPKVGWEGFAAMNTSQINQEIVLAAISQFRELS